MSDSDKIFKDYRFIMLFLKKLSPILIATSLGLIPFNIVTGKTMDVSFSGEREEKSEIRNNKVIKIINKSLLKVAESLDSSLDTNKSRLALVIGNANYQYDSLNNPLNDATDVARSLEELGFEVILLTDVDWKTMDVAIEDFSKELDKGGIGLFYYAGHGVQVKGENYLIPIDAELTRERDVLREAISLTTVLNSMEEAETQVQIVMIDACRDNPFYRQWHRTRGSSIVRGLSQIDIPAEGSIVAFSTAPGDFAEDGKGQRNSPFTTSLLKHIKTPNLEIANMFRRVRTEVLRETNSQQRPWYRESLVGSFFFNSTEKSTVTFEPSSTPTDNTTPQSITRSFSDTDRDIYKDGIEQAVALGLINGYGDRTFRPVAPITREQLASMIFEVVGKIPNLNRKPIRRVKTQPYPDVDTSRWSASKIYWAKTNNIMTGYVDGSFRPANPVTRAELIAVLSQVAKFVKTERGESVEFEPTTVVNTFSDIYDHWASDTIQTMSGFCNVASPYNETGNSFLPNELSGRNYATIATLRLYRCLIENSI